MCFSSSAPKPTPPPPVPAIDDEAVKNREALERQRLLAQQGTAGTVKTDLAPKSLQGQRKVLLGV